MTGRQEYLLAVNRAHREAVQIGIYSVREVALGEDARRVRNCSVPRVIAAFANLEISILHLQQGKTASAGRTTCI